MHETRIQTFGNGGAKSRKAFCSCGWHGPRVGFGPAFGVTIKDATVQAEAYAAEHIAAQS